MLDFFNFLIGFYQCKLNSSLEDKIPASLYRIIKRTKQHKFVNCSVGKSILSLFIILESGKEMKWWIIITPILNYIELVYGLISTHYYLEFIEKFITFIVGCGFQHFWILRFFTVYHDTRPSSIKVNLYNLVPVGPLSAFAIVLAGIVAAILYISWFEMTFISCCSNQE